MLRKVGVLAYDKNLFLVFLLIFLLQFNHYFPKTVFIYNNVFLFQRLQSIKNEFKKDN
jgi:hypothetical protein